MHCGKCANVLCVSLNHPVNAATLINFGSWFSRNLIRNWALGIAFSSNFIWLWTKKTGCYIVNLSSSTFKIQVLWLAVATALLCYRVQKRWHHKKLFLHFNVLDTMYRWSMMKNIHSPNLVGIGSWEPEIWPHEYLISPTEISLDWPGSSVGLIRYSCGHISGHHEPIHVKFGVWWFSSCSTEIWS